MFLDVATPYKEGCNNNFTGLCKPLEMEQGEAAGVAAADSDGGAGSRNAGRSRHTAKSCAKLTPGVLNPILEQCIYVSTSVKLTLWKAFIFIKLSRCDYDTEITLKLALARGYFTLHWCQCYKIGYKTTLE